MNSLHGAIAALLFTMLASFIALLPDVLPEPAPKPVDPHVTENQSSFHISGHENAWIQFVDAKKGLVQVQTTKSRMDIDFRPKNRRDISRFQKNWITPVTFLCRDGNTDCEIGSQVKTYIGNVEVEPTTWKTIDGQTRLEIKMTP